MQLEVHEYSFIVCDRRQRESLLRDQLYGSVYVSLLTTRSSLLAAVETQEFWQQAAGALPLAQGVWATVDDGQYPLSVLRNSSSDVRTHSVPVTKQLTTRMQICALMVDVGLGEELKRQRYEHSIAAKVH